MTLEDLIVEGRAIARRCVFLRSEEKGSRVGTWHEATEPRHRRWLTVDAAFMSLSDCRYVSVLSDHSGRGWIERLAALPEASTRDVPLFASDATVLPPLDAIFARGSERVGSWLSENGWPRDCPYNPNFPDRAPAQEYERAFQAEHPLYSSAGVFAVIGGWHFPFPDDDWHDLIDNDLLLMTFADAEPWIEVWRDKTGQIKVIERVT
jgi:hypothetical protein